MAKRRKWTKREKAQLSLASFGDGVVIVKFCDQHNVPLSTLYSWRRSLLDFLSEVL